MIEAKYNLGRRRGKMIYLDGDGVTLNHWLVPSSMCCESYNDMGLHDESAAVLIQCDGNERRFPALTCRLACPRR